MKHILTASLCLLPLEDSKAKTAPSILHSDAAMDLLKDSVNLELEDYMELQSDHSIGTNVDSTETEADFLLEERLSQFSDELQLESDLSLEEASLIIDADNEDINAENIAPSRALSVRYLGSESVLAHSTNPTDTLLNPSIMGIESEGIVPVDLSVSNSPALTDYSHVENSEPLLRPEGRSTTVATHSLQAPESSYAASSAPSSSYSSSGGGVTGGGGGGAIAYQSASEGAIDANNSDNYDINVPFNVYGKQLIGETESEGMIFTIADEQGENPLPSNFNIQINGYEVINPETGLLEKPTLDGQGLYSGFQMLYTNTGSKSPTITIDDLHSMQNFYKGVNGDAVGGAITLINEKSEIIFNNDVDNPITFENNHVYTTSLNSGSSAAGGAIFLSGGPSVGDLRANFYNNTATIASPERWTSSRYARGGAIAIGFIDDYPTGYQPIASFSVIDSITGDFVDNKASFGGAIYTGAYSSIGNITGNFVRNIAEGYVQSGHSSGADGGAFRTYVGTIGAITGDFTDNTAHAYTGNALGGAISLWLTNIKGTITGTFEGNMAFSDKASAWGGALSLRDQGNTTPLQLTDVSFYNNVAGTGTTNTNNVRGGAIYITNSSDVIITAANENVVIRDNYTITNSSVTKNTNGVNNEQWTYNIVEGAGAARDYTAIYLDGSNLTLETTAGSDKTITIDDAIKSSVSTVNSIITVNDVSHADTENAYGVFLNGELGMDKLVVETGGVQLGSATHSDGSTTTGSFVNQADVQVKQSARIRTNADYLAQVGHVALEGIDRNNAALLNLTGGTLTSDINKGTSSTSTGTRSGHIAITGSTVFGIDSTTADKTEIYSDTLSILNTLELQDSASISAKTLFFYGTDMNDTNNTNHITAHTGTSFAFDKIELNFGEANIGDTFDIITSADGEIGYLNINYELESTAVLHLGSGGELVQGEDFIVRWLGEALLDAEGNVQYYTVAGTTHQEIEIDPDKRTGLQVEILKKYPPVPEPSTVTLSLIALAAFLRRRRRAA